MQQSWATMQVLSVQLFLQNKKEIYMTDYSSFVNGISSSDCRVLTDFPMSRQTTFKAGGNADIIVFPATTDALISILKAAKSENILCTVLGNGSNVLVKDEGIRGVVIKMTSLVSDIEVAGTTIKCAAGVSLSKLCVAAYENGLTGLEFAYGIPGTVGGAVYMNAGAYGGEMKDVLKSVSHITPELSKETFTAEKLDLGYRTSFYAKNPDYIITQAVFGLKQGDKTDIKAKMDDLLGRRKDKQPLEFPSAGSTFKRPEGHFAGALIEQCGLKGYSVGGAQVSEKHAGFVINKNGTASDILALIDYIKKTVKKNTGIELEPEVKIIP